MRTCWWMVVLAGCSSLPGPVNPPDGSYCERAEARLQELQCIVEDRVLGSPNKKGETYSQVCLRVEREAKVSMRSRCIAVAQDCEEVRSCQAQ
jgi:hypothetical protein